MRFERECDLYQNIFHLFNRCIFCSPFLLEHQLCGALCMLQTKIQCLWWIKCVPQEKIPGWLGQKLVSGIMCCFCLCACACLPASHKVIWEERTEKVISVFWMWSLFISLCWWSFFFWLNVNMPYLFPSMYIKDDSIIEKRGICWYSRSWVCSTI